MSGRSLARLRWSAVRAGSGAAHGARQHGVLELVLAAAAHRHHVARKEREAEARRPAAAAAARSAARSAAACHSGDRATHSAASSAVAKQPRLTFLRPRHTLAWKGFGWPGWLRLTQK